MHINYVVVESEELVVVEEQEASEETRVVPALESSCSCGSEVKERKEQHVWLAAWGRVHSF